MKLLSIENYLTHNNSWQLLSHLSLLLKGDCKWKICLKELMTPVSISWLAFWGRGFTAMSYFATYTLSVFCKPRLDLMLMTAEASQTGRA